MEFVTDTMRRECRKVQAQCAAMGAIEPEYTQSGKPIIVDLLVFISLMKLVSMVERFCVHRMRFFRRWWPLTIICLLLGLVVLRGNVIHVLLLLSSVSDWALENSNPPKYDGNGGWPVWLVAAICLYMGLAREHTMMMEMIEKQKAANEMAARILGDDNPENATVEDIPEVTDAVAKQTIVAEMTNLKTIEKELIQLNVDEVLEPPLSRAEAEEEMLL